MVITLLYFAVTRELVGRSEEQVTLPAGVRLVADLPAFLATHAPPLAGRLGQIRLARNEVFADPDEVLAEGDVIALIPPVAGG
jgi:molybdopterin synthase sulfur carrier subunit